MVARVTGPTPAGGVLEGTFPNPSDFSPAGEAAISGVADVLVDAEAVLRAAGDATLTTGLSQRRQKVPSDPDLYEMGLTPNTGTDAGAATANSDALDAFLASASPEGLAISVPPGRWELARDLVELRSLTFYGRGAGGTGTAISALSFAAGKGMTLGYRKVSATVTNKALTSNVATLTTAAAHGATVGQWIVVAGMGVPFDGTHRVLSAPTTTTFTYAKTAANVASAAATGTASDPWGTHGLFDLAVFSRNPGGPTDALLLHDITTNSTTTIASPSNGITAAMVGREVMAPGVYLGTTLLSRASDGSTGILSAAAYSSLTAQTFGFVTVAESGVRIGTPFACVHHCRIENFGRFGLHLDAGSHPDSSDFLRSVNFASVLRTKTALNKGIGLVLESGIHGANECNVDHHDATGNGVIGIWNNGYKNKFRAHVDYNYGIGYLEEGGSDQWRPYAESSNYPYGDRFLFGPQASGNEVWPDELGAPRPPNLTSANTWHGIYGTQNILNVARPGLDLATDRVLYADAHSGDFRLGRGGSNWVNFRTLVSDSLGGNVTIPNLAPGEAFTWYVDVDAATAETLNASIDTLSDFTLSSMTGRHTTGLLKSCDITSSVVVARLTFTVLNVNDAALNLGSSYWRISVFRRKV